MRHHEPQTRRPPGRTPRVCAKTSVGQEAYFGQNDPHPDPLPSDGRGNSQTRLSQLPKRLDTSTDGGGFSLSHPMGYVFTVAQIFNLPYRRFVIGRASLDPKTLDFADGPQVTNLRY